MNDDQCPTCGGSISTPYSEEIVRTYGHAGTMRRIEALRGILGNEVIPLEERRRRIIEIIG